MPTAFTAEEKARITGVLLEQGHRLFTTQGLRKTSLDELVAPAGVAKSTFYQFFDSKEALYLELMLRQMGAVKKRVIDDALLAEDDVGEGLRRFLRAAVAELTGDPLWRRLTTHPEEMAAVARKLDPAEALSSPDNPAGALTSWIALQVAEGDLLQAEPSVIAGVLQAVLLAPMNAERLGSPEDYPKILDLLIDIVAEGLASRKS